MDLFIKKRGIHPEISEYVKNLKYKDNKINIVGSSMTHKYFGDYDLNTTIDKKNLYENIMKIIYKCEENPNMYFIELKIQKKNSKKKFYNIEDIDKEAFKDAIYIKLDYIIKVDFNFFELSNIYIVKKTDYNYIEEILKDIEDLKKERFYFKILKRLYSINSFYNRNNRPVNEQVVKIINNFLNSESGRDYQIMEILKANKRLLENYDDEKTINQVLENLKSLKIKPDLKYIDKIIKQIYKKINKDAKIIYDDINMKYN